MEECNDCDLMYICGGGCRVENYERNKNMLIPVCTEEKRQRIYRELVNDTD